MQPYFKENLKLVKSKISETVPFVFLGAFSPAPLFDLTGEYNYFISGEISNLNNHSKENFSMFWRLWAQARSLQGGAI
jgi:hypothetical protein